MKICCPLAWIQPKWFHDSHLYFPIVDTHKVASPLTADRMITKMWSLYYTYTNYTNIKRFAGSIIQRLIIHTNSCDPQYLDITMPAWWMAKRKSPLWRLCGFNITNSLPLYGLGLDQFGVFIANLVLNRLTMITSWLHIILGFLCWMNARYVCMQ